VSIIKVLPQPTPPHKYLRSGTAHAQRYTGHVTGRSSGINSAKRNGNANNGGNGRYSTKQATTTQRQLQPAPQRMDTYTPLVLWEKRPEWAPALALGPLSAVDAGRVNRDDSHDDPWLAGAFAA
jgi:hypothetical protein